MKTLQKYRNIWALGLILILLPVFAVKCFHSHENLQTFKTEAENHDDDCGGVNGICKICDFLLSPFQDCVKVKIEVFFKEFIVSESQTVYETVIRENEVTTLRAPPVSSLNIF